MIFITLSINYPTNLLYADKNLKSLEETVNNELLKVSEWLNAKQRSMLRSQIMSLSVLISVSWVIR